MTQLSRLLREFATAVESDQDIERKARRAADRAVQRAVQDEVNRLAANLPHRLRDRRMANPTPEPPAAVRATIPTCLRRIT